MTIIRVKKIRPQAILPRYMTKHAAGCDLFAALEESLALEPGARTLIPTGLVMEVPVGYEGQVRPRSGLALREGLTLVNAPGTIDADFRGEVGVIVINHGQDTCVIQPGDRIAQLVVAPVVDATFQEVEEVSSTDRGKGGFGHTGSRTS